MIRAEGLCKKYGDRWAIKNLSFNLEKGDVVGLLGPNGAGKSTTMKILTGYMSPTSGRVEVCGFDVFEKPLEVKRRIGYLPENPPIYLDMLVEDYLSYVAELKQVSSANKKQYIEKALEKTQLLNVRRRLIKNLSKGFKQRVGIAQALVSQPEILVLDEPTVGLDPKQVSEIRNLLQELKTEHTIILSTHILSEVEAVCNKIIILNRGEIVAVKELSANSPVTSASKVACIRLMTSKEGDLTESLQKMNGVQSVQKQSTTEYRINYTEDVNNLDAFAKLVMDAELGVKKLYADEGSLEDVFMQYTYNNKEDEA